LAVAGRSENRTECEIIAEQNQDLKTKYRTTKIFQTETKSTGRLGQEFDETV
jgi:hypothetical protein